MGCHPGNSFCWPCCWNASIVIPEDGPLRAETCQTDTYLLHRAESFWRSWRVLTRSRNSPNSMEPEGSLPHSQVPTTCPCLEPDRSSPCLLSHFLKIHLDITLPSTPGSSNRSLPSGFPTKTMYAPPPPNMLHSLPIPAFLIWSPK